MLGRGLTSVGADDGIVDIQVGSSGSGIRILIIFVGSVSRKNDGGILGQLSLKSLLTKTLNSQYRLLHNVNAEGGYAPEQIGICRYSYLRRRAGTAVRLLVPLPLRLHVGLRDGLDLLHYLRLIQLESCHPVWILAAAHLADLVSTTL